MMRRIVMFGWKTPKGGVTRSIETTCTALDRLGISTDVVEYRLRNIELLRGAARTIIHPPAMTLLHVSGPASFLVASLLAQLIPRSVIYMHGETTARAFASKRPFWRIARTLRTAIDRRRAQIWVNNESAATCLRKSVRGVATVSPFPEVASYPTCPTVKATSPLRILTTAYRGQVLYNLRIAAEAARLIADTTPVRLTVVLYGGVSCDTESSVRSEIGPTDAVVELCVDPTDESYMVLLESSHVLLRLTDTDGDSLVVREMLALGKAVVASRRCPRPEGVVLCELEATDVADAVLNIQTRPTSDGAGLGVPVDRSILRYLDRISAK